jgi:streptogramin lyase
MRCHPFGQRVSASAASILTLVAAGIASVARGQVVTEFPVTTAASAPREIAVGPDGNLWFTEYEANQIGRMTTAGVLTEFPVPTFGGYPAGITIGPDGNLWFAEELAGQIARITTAGVITEFPVPTALAEPYGIATGPDGNLWFTDAGDNLIGRVTTAGDFTMFPIPTDDSAPVGITAGRDGNLWFAESQGNNIGRITTAGVITEFPLPAPLSEPNAITAGPDGNVWFAEYLGNAIGTITPAGVITEFPIPTTAATPEGIAAGPDNLWFTEHGGNQIGRITTSGGIKEFAVPTAGSGPMGITAAYHPLGEVWFTEYDGNQIGAITKGMLLPVEMDVDGMSVTGGSSNANHVLEPGETVQVAPAWLNTLVVPIAFGGVASDLTGPSGPTYTINDTTASYGTVPGPGFGSCIFTGDCYLMTVSGTRPAAHWDVTFTETLAETITPDTGTLPTRTWTLHIGDSFADVPATNADYVYVEDLFHNGITGGCSGGNYCPTASVSRAQMAVFLMKSKLGALETPPPATGTVFNDVPSSNPFAPFIEQLAGFEISGGCGGGDYCPDNPVTRAQMAVFLLKAEHGSAYAPPPCTGIFSDVECSPTPAFAVNWIEQLSREGITSGCGSGNYCPGAPNTRGQMAVFLVKTFHFELYGP